MFKCCALFGNFTGDSPTLSTSRFPILAWFLGFCFFFPELLSNSVYSKAHSGWIYVKVKSMANR